MNNFKWLLIIWWAFVRLEKSLKWIPRARSEVPKSQALWAAHTRIGIVGDCLSRASGDQRMVLCELKLRPWRSEDLPKKGRKPYLGKEVLEWTSKPCFRSLSLFTVIEFTGKIVSSLNATWHAKPREHFRKEIQQIFLESLVKRMKHIFI